MGCSHKLSEFQLGILIGCHLCNKSSCEISSLLKIPPSTVRDRTPLGRIRVETESQAFSSINHQSIYELKIVLLEQWSKAPMNMLLNLENSLTRRTEAVMDAKGGSTSYRGVVA
ncbi:hypothetical protein GOODEAATRI_033112 [Goodea atripinnis]|uniref:Uncharacterized protein n=1 Tax=Goodea atripinnis TaxID=208336 RepID=A0ABV0NQ76_9TELE